MHGCYYTYILYRILPLYAFCLAVEDVGADTANLAVSKMPPRRSSSGYSSMISQQPSLGESSQSSIVHSGIMVSERSTTEGTFHACM